MKRKQWFTLIISLCLFTACTPVASQPSTSIADETGGTAAVPGSELSQSSYSPVSDDQSKMRGDVHIDSMVIQVQDSFPPSYSLNVKGSLPTPCHQLREVVEQPTDESEINLQVYSVFDPYTVCSQELRPFETSIPLGSYVRGSYKVYVNGQEVGKIVP